MWSGWQDFWVMGGYGLYVWGSYGVMAAALAIEVTLLAVRRRNILNQLGLAARDRRGCGGSQTSCRGRRRGRRSRERRRFSRERR